MCGIWAFCNLRKNVIHNLADMKQAFQKIQHRGPDDSCWMEHECGIMGFHRLSIQDFSTAGRQPFQESSNSVHTSWICNGEIYNYKELKMKLKKNEWKSHSDCEIIGPWFLEKWFQQTNINAYNLMNPWDGDYAGVVFIWDTNTNSGFILAFRDPMGVRPLFWGLQEDQLFFCSEAKGIPLANELIHPFPHGSIWICPLGNETSTYLKPEHNNLLFPPIAHSVGVQWANPIVRFPKIHPSTLTEKQIHAVLRQLLKESVTKRLLSDRPIACLLSGGLDSSLIAGLAQQIMRRTIPDYKLPTFSIGFENAPDLIAARKVAQWIDSDHHEIIITPEEALQKIPIIVQTLETWDPTTIRASTCMYLAAEYIKKNTPYVVVLSGEGSDELFEGYLYFHRAPTPNDGNEDSKRLIMELPYFDVLRADRTTAAHGLELRVPFLDKELMRFVIHMKDELKSAKRGRMEKSILREAFETTNLLPSEILWRVKEAFSDGISLPKYSWFQMIQEYAAKQLDPNFQFQWTTDEEKERQERASQTIEAKWFRQLFQQYYKGGDHWIPHVWLPKWTNTIDPSARTLE